MYNPDITTAADRERAPRSTRRKRFTLASLIVAILLWILVSLPSKDGAPGSIAHLIVSIGFALILRFIYVKARRRDERVIVPATFFTAALIAFFAVLGQNGS